MAGMQGLITSVVPVASPWLVVGSQRLRLSMVSSWRSNTAMVTAGAVVLELGGKVADGEQPMTPPEPVINLELGDPTMYEAFWKEAGDCAAVVIPGWRGMSYFADAAGGLCCFLEPEFEREVRRLHRLVGNAAVDGYHLVVGTGATQLSQAAMYALSPADADHPIGVVSPAPYYSAYAPQTELLLSGFYRWGGDANALGGGGGSHIEMVWALVKDLEVAKKMVYFVDRSTIGVSRDSQLRATKILSLVSDAFDDDKQGNDDTRRRRVDLFDFAQRRMAERWRALRAAVASTGAFSLPEETSGYCTFSKRTVAATPAFAWLRCEKEGVENCGELLRGHGVLAQGGERFGGDARCVRVNMLERDRVFDILIQRLSSIY